MRIALILPCFFVVFTEAASAATINFTFKAITAEVSFNGAPAVMKFRLLAKTQFRDQQGAAIRDSLLRPGDQLSVIVNPDDPETAVGVVLVRKRERN
jgi:hypothetical protein